MMKTRKYLTLVIFFLIATALNGQSLKGIAINEPMPTDIKTNFVKTDKNSQFVTLRCTDKHMTVGGVEGRIIVRLWETGQVYSVIFKSKDPLTTEVVSKFKKNVESYYDIEFNNLNDPTHDEFANADKDGAHYHLLVGDYQSANSKLIFSITSIDLYRQIQMKHIENLKKKAEFAAADF